MISEIRFGFSLVSALTNPLSMEEVRELVKSRREDRSEKFLALCDSEIFYKDSSPYKRLFESAGYSRERLSQLVHSKGLERALSALAVDGVYLDIKEFKGQKPVVRPGLKMYFDASLTDISSGPSIPLRSSGSSGPRMTTHIGVKGLRLFSSYIPLLLEGLDALSLPIVLYYPMPSVSGVVHLIIFAMAGFPPASWFSQVPFPARHRMRPSVSTHGLARYLQVAWSPFAIPGHCGNSSSCGARPLALKKLPSWSGCADFSRIRLTSSPERPFGGYQAAAPDFYFRRRAFDGTQIRFHQRVWPSCLSLVFIGRNRQDCAGLFSWNIPR